MTDCTVLFSPGVTIFKMNPLVTDDVGCLYLEYPSCRVWHHKSFGFVPSRAKWNITEIFYPLDSLQIHRAEVGGRGRNNSPGRVKGTKIAASKFKGKTSITFFLAMLVRMLTFPSWLLQSEIASVYFIDVYKTSMIEKKNTWFFPFYLINKCSKDTQIMFSLISLLNSGTWWHSSALKWQHTSIFFF